MLYYKIDNDRIYISIKNKNALIEIVTAYICNVSGSLISIYFNWHYIFPLREAINVCR